jgi:hypothetical protein
MKSSTKRILAYRTLSIGTEFLIVFFVTGSIVIPTITTPTCIVIHTLIHWGIERMIK